jgi:hypothetical protein
LLTCVILSEKLLAQNGFLRTLVPHHLKIQHGGGIGYLAFGPGYTNSNKKLEYDLLYGYLPEKIGGVAIHSATFKCSWIPFSIETHKMIVKPLVTGGLLNYAFGKQYFSFNPPNYSYGYYNFPTAINSAIFLGGRAGKNVWPAGKKKEISIYYELLIFDRELISYIGNTRVLDFDDIFTLGFGLKFAFN